jgi:NhaP-type Na+/H+ or K+/H+ antiporter
LLDFFVFFLFGIIVTQVIGQLTLADLLYALVSLTVVRMVPVALAVAGLRLHTATVLFMGWFGPRGLASIVLGLVYLAQEAHLAGEQVIIAAVTATVLVSIYAHGISAVPGIALYVRKVSGLGTKAAEYAEVSGEGASEHTA